MKQILMVFAMSTIFLACKNKGNNGLATDKNLVLTDTSLLKNHGVLSDTGYGTKGVTQQHINGETSTSSTTTTVTTTTTTGNPHNKVGTTNHAGNKKPANNHSTPSKVKSTSTGHSGNSETTTTTPVKRDRGWSDAAKGTAIGAGSGAVVGAVVSKNKVKGAVIGGVVGAAGGYAIGRDRDRKSGRVERNRKQ